MAEHRGTRRSPWWRLRNAYDRLRREHAELEARYRALESDHLVLVGDLEALRAAGPEPVVPRTVPGWALRDLDETQEIALAPEQAAALTRRTGLLESPSGSLSRPEGTTG